MTTRREDETGGEVMVVHIEVRHTRSGERRSGRDRRTSPRDGFDRRSGLDRRGHPLYQAAARRRASPDESAAVGRSTVYGRH